MKSSSKPCAELIEVFTEPSEALNWADSTELVEAWTELVEAWTELVEVCRSEYWWGEVVVFSWF